MGAELQAETEQTMSVVVRTSETDERDLVFPHIARQPRDDASGGPPPASEAPKAFAAVKKPDSQIAKCFAQVLRLNRLILA